MLWKLLKYAESVSSQVKKLRRGVSVLLHVRAVQTELKLINLNQSVAWDLWFLPDQGVFIGHFHRNSLFPDRWQQPNPSITNK